VIRPTVIEMYRRVVAGEPPVRQELRAG
jgi:hypothetical protein